MVIATIPQTEWDISSRQQPKWTDSLVLSQPTLSQELCSAAHINEYLGQGRFPKVPVHTNVQLPTYSFRFADYEQIRLSWSQIIDVLFQSTYFVLKGNFYRYKLAF